MKSKMNAAVSIALLLSLIPALVIGSADSVTQPAFSQRALAAAKSPKGIAALLIAAALSSGGAAWANGASKKAKSEAVRKRLALVKKILASLGIIAGAAATAGGVGYAVDAYGAQPDKVSGKKVDDDKSEKRLALVSAQSPGKPVVADPALASVPGGGSAGGQPKTAEEIIAAAFPEGYKPKATGGMSPDKFRSALNLGNNSSVGKTGPPHENFYIIADTDKRHS